MKVDLKLAILQILDKKEGLFVHLLIGFSLKKKLKLFGSVNFVGGQLAAYDNRSSGVREG